MQNQPSNEELMAQQQQMANGQMGNVASGMSEMVQAGQQMFGQNPMMNILGGMLGMPVKMQTPEFLQNFINKYNPPAPQQPTQEQQFGQMPNQMPVGPNGQPFDINEHMRGQNLGMRALPDDHVPRHGAMRDIKNIMSQPGHAFNPESRNRSGGGFMGY